MEIKKQVMKLFYSITHFLLWKLLYSKKTPVFLIQSTQFLVLFEIKKNKSYIETKVTEF